MGPPKKLKKYDSKPGTDRSSKLIYIEIKCFCLEHKNRSMDIPHKKLKQYIAR